VSCKVESSGSLLSRKDWMTDEGTYGELTSSNDTNLATFMRVSCGLARELLSPKNVVLNELGRSIQGGFEVAIGVNGAVWVHSSAAAHTILICNAVRNSEVLTDEQTRGMVRALLKSIHAV